jgi:type II secretory pathway pseudopilin PulG
MPMRTAHTLRRILDRARRGEDGFTMILTLCTLVIAGLLTAAALNAAMGDTGLTRNDLDQKDAYYAAQAGISDYAFHLNADVNYWTYCTAVPTPSAVNQIGANPLIKRAVAGSAGESYAIELLPANGKPSCDHNNPIATMIESTGAAAGTFRIRATGYSGGTPQKLPVTRSIVATFRRVSFVDFIYYTEYETLSPSAYGTPSDRAAAAAACDVFWRNSRPAANGNRNYCSQIVFQSGDAINGPLHTEDELAICGNPVFGRSKADRIEVVAPAPGHSSQGVSGCSDNANFKGTYVSGADSLKPPPTNAQLYQIAVPPYRWTGQTHISLNGTNMTVTNNGSTNTYGPPANGIVYVSTSSCPITYTPFSVNYTDPTATGCGNVTVDGTYSGALTIASDNDIVIDGNLTHTGNGLLGLIAQNYVRVYHPFPVHTAGTCGNGSNSTGTIRNVNIDAAILAVSGSFIVDNYDCGASLGTLTVNGAIAQVFRGPVGLTGGQAGFVKNYNYDDRLSEQEPPYFLNPIEAAWHIQRKTECAAGTPVICP